MFQNQVQEDSWSCVWSSAGNASKSTLKLKILKVQEAFWSYFLVWRWKCINFFVWEWKYVKTCSNRPPRAVYRFITTSVMVPNNTLD